MKTSRCPLCRVTMEQSADGKECPDCGHFEPFTKIKTAKERFAEMRAVVEKTPDYDDKKVSS